MIKIRDQKELVSYLETMPERITDITAVKYVDSGMDLKEFIQQFYNNEDEAVKDCVLFVELYDVEQAMESNRSGLTIIGNLVLQKVAGGSGSLDILEARNTAMKLLAYVFGLWECDFEDNRLEDSENYWELRREDRQLRATAEMGNNNAWGYIGGFELYMEAGAIIYDNQ